ncbi:MAG TPA: hypothetical protein VFI54_06410 [Solirubrobacteraceae bacterium]|nr:hypothetical protein [Solirubrobacteraceae bacterium]
MSQSESVKLNERTGEILVELRSHPGPTLELGHEHTRLNVLMRKGLARNLGLGKWEATELGRRVTIHMPTYSVTRADR